MKYKSYLLLFLTLFITLAPLSAARRKVIIDTDCDMDDMMAILYLLKCKQVEVVAITTTGTGMAQWQYTAPNILKLLQLAHKPNIPVSYGAKTPLSPFAQFPEDWRKGVDEVFNIPLPDNPHPPSPWSSAKLIAKIVEESDEPVSILALAPLTNIAIAIEQNPSIVDHIEEVVISGGAVHHKGNIVGAPHGFQNKCAEYNIFLDAKAAEMVISSGIPITLVPLNATDQAPITPQLYNEFKAEKRNSSAQFVMDVIKPFVDSQTNTSVYLWDPVAAAILTNPSIGHYNQIPLAVNLTKGPQFGCTMEDQGGEEVQVCMAINTQAFYSLFFRTISRGN